MYIQPEDENSNVIIDFNKSLNPYAYFQYSLPVLCHEKENKLPIKISLGKKIMMAFYLVVSINNFLYIKDYV